MIKQTVKIPMDDLEEQKKILATRYLKLIDLQEQAFIRLQTDKPVVQVLDSPYIDITKHPSTSGASIVFGLLGFLLSIGYLLRNPVIRFVRAELAKNKAAREEEDTADEL
jgi:penicillin V acylase-like amidase (Ntn superfamily)